jgi:tetratricopeptide (TPR) repeat protein
VVATAELNDAIEAFRRGDLDRAQALAEASVESGPSAQSQHLLGLIHCRRGDPATGVEWLLRACEAEPDNLAYRVIASRALVDSGRAGEVLAMPEPPPIESPAALALWQGRGEAADAAGDNIASERAWWSVTSAAPNDWRAWSNLGNALAGQARWSEAAQALGQAIRLNPAELPLWRNLAGAFASAERHEDALRLADEWDRVLGTTGEQAVVRGRALAALQRFDEAQAAYTEAIELRPGDPAAWAGLGLVYERTGQSGRLAELIGAAAAAGVTPEQLGFLPVIRALHEGRIEEGDRLLEAIDPGSDPMQWHRLKSRLADRSGRFAEAFAAAAAMNGSVDDLEGWVRRGADYRGRLRAMAEAVSSATRNALEPAALTPVFLVGFPRSGTTLLDTFLMGHSKIRVLEELPLIMEAEKVCPVAQADACPADTLARARDTYFAALGDHAEPGFDGTLVDKMPLNMLAVPLIRALFPGARFIFAQRHPCDAVLSGFMQSFVASEPMASFLTIEGAADFYDSAMTLWTKSIESAPVDCRTIVYEELANDPEATLRPLIAFLGLEWEDRLLDHRGSARSRGAIVTPSYNQVTEPLSTKAVGRWRNYSEQLKPVLPLLLPWAERLGYSDD